MSEESAGSADAATAAAPAPSSAPVSRWRHRPFIEIVAVAMLSVTAILTAWCGFQASKWSGERAIAFAEASAARVEATDADSQAREARVVDLIIYAEWVTATAQGDTALAEEIAARFTPHFRVAFDAWEAGGQVEPGPFAMAEYVPPGTEQSAERSAYAEAALRGSARGYRAGRQLLAADRAVRARALPHGDGPARHPSRRGVDHARARRPHRRGRAHRAAHLPGPLLTLHVRRVCRSCVTDPRHETRHPASLLWRHTRAPLTRKRQRDGDARRSSFDGPFGEASILPCACPRLADHARPTSASPLVSALGCRDAASWLRDARSTPSRRRRLAGAAMRAPAAGAAVRAPRTARARHAA